MLMKKYIKILFYFLFIINAKSSFACLADTHVEELDSFKKEFMQPEAHTSSVNEANDYLEKLKQPCYQVRTQIVDDLRYFGLVDEALDPKRFAEPVLCFGTGKNKYMLSLLHLRPTIVEEGDETVDIKAKLNPDHHFNAFSDTSLYELCEKKKNYSAIYLSHVARFFPLDSFLFKCYAKLLNPGGVFLYKSFAFMDSVSIPDIFDLKSFAEIEDRYIDMMSQHGFRNIRVIERDEYSDLKDESKEKVGRSYMVYAERDDSYQDELAMPDFLKKMRKAEKDTELKEDDVREGSLEIQKNLEPAEDIPDQRTPKLTEEIDLNSTVEISSESVDEIQDQRTPELPEEVDHDSSFEFYSEPVGKIQDQRTPELPEEINLNSEIERFSNDDDSE